jgi:hypothetical protein
MSRELPRNHLGGRQSKEDESQEAGREMAVNKNKPEVLVR